MTLTRRTAIAASAALAGLTLETVVAEAQPHDEHPRLRAAIRALDGAKDDLEHAAHDFGGHRADALRACDEAIRQLRLAVNYRP